MLGIIIFFHAWFRKAEYSHPFNYQNAVIHRQSSSFASCCRSAILLEKFLQNIQRTTVHVILSAAILSGSDQLLPACHLRSRAAHSLTGSDRTRRACHRSDFLSRVEQNEITPSGRVLSSSDCRYQRRLAPGMACAAAFRAASIFAQVAQRALNATRLAARALVRMIDVLLAVQHCSSPFRAMLITTARSIQQRFVATHAKQQDAGRKERQSLLGLQNAQPASNLQPITRESEIEAAGASAHEVLARAQTKSRRRDWPRNALPPTTASIRLRYTSTAQSVLRLAAVPKHGQRRQC